MTKKLLLSLTLVTALVLAGSLPAAAVPAAPDIELFHFWSFENPAVNVTPVNTFTFASDPPGPTITANAVSVGTPNPAPPSNWNGAFISPPNTPLFSKLNIGGGAEEHGLGLLNFANNEIQTTTWISLNLSQLVNAGLKQLFLDISSIQVGEGFSLFTHNGASHNLFFLSNFTNTGTGTGITNGGFVTPDVPNPTPGDAREGVIVDLTKLGNDDTLYITASAVDVLIDDAFVVPLPPSVLLMGSGLLGLAVMRLRRRA